MYFYRFMKIYLLIIIIIWIVRNEPGWSMILLLLVEKQQRNLSLWQSVSKHLLRKRNLVTMTKSTAPPVKPIKWSQRSYKYGDFPQSSSYILNGFKTSTLDGSNLTRLLTSPLLSLIQRVTWQLFLQPLWPDTRNSLLQDLGPKSGAALGQSCNK